MTTQEAIEFFAREVEKRKWFEDAKAYAESLLALDKKRAQAEADRDKALEARDKALADIEARKKRDAAAADRERVALAAELKQQREVSDKAVAKDKAEVAKLQAQLDRLLVLKTEAEEQHAAKMAKYAAAESDALSRVNALIAQETEIRGRLAAALGR